MVVKACSMRACRAASIRLKSALASGAEKTIHKPRNASLPSISWKVNDLKTWSPKACKVTELLFQSSGAPLRLPSDEAQLPAAPAPHAAPPSGATAGQPPPPRSPPASAAGGPHPNQDLMASWHPRQGSQLGTSLGPHPLDAHTFQALRHVVVTAPGLARAPALARDGACVCSRAACTAQTGLATAEKPHPERLKPPLLRFSCCRLPSALRIHGAPFSRCRLQEDP